MTCKTAKARPHHPGRRRAFILGKSKSARRDCQRDHRRPVVLAVEIGEAVGGPGGTVQRHAADGQAILCDGNRFTRQITVLVAVRIAVIVTQGRQCVAAISSSGASRRAGRTGLGTAFVRF